MEVTVSDPSASPSTAPIESGIALSSSPEASDTVTVGSSATAWTVTLRVALVVAEPPAASALARCDAARRDAHLRRDLVVLPRRRHRRGEPLVLIFFLTGKKILLVCLYRYLYNFLTFIIASYIVRWFWYPPPSALVLSMIRMWYILSFYNYLVHLLFMTIMPTNVT